RERREDVEEHGLLRRQADDRLRRGLCARRSRRAWQPRQLRRRVRGQRGERRQRRHRAGSKPLTALFVLVSITAWAKGRRMPRRPLRYITTVLMPLAFTAQAAPPPSLPASEDTARERLEHSPRHGEFVTVDAGGTPVRVWVVYPERKDKASVVVVIHEIFGLTDWIRAVADQLAADGFIAVAPDLLAGKGPKGGGTAAFPSRDDAVKAVSALPRDEVIARLNAVRKYGLSLPAATGKSATVGFCWGGSTSFAYAVA